MFKIFAWIIENPLYALCYTLLVKIYQFLFDERPVKVFCETKN